MFLKAAPGSASEYANDYILWPSLTSSAAFWLWTKDAPDTDHCSPAVSADASTGQLRAALALQLQNISTGEACHVARACVLPHRVVHPPALTSRWTIHPFTLILRQGLSPVGGRSPSQTQSSLIRVHFLPCLTSNKAKTAPCRLPYTQHHLGSFGWFCRTLTRWPRGVSLWTNTLCWCFCHVVRGTAERWHVSLCMQTRAHSCTHGPIASAPTSSGLWYR